MRLTILIALAFLSFFLCCVNIEKIEQPDSVKAGDGFKVKITGAIGDTSNSEGQKYYGIIGILVPDDWKVSEVKYSNSVKGEMVRKERLMTALDLEYPTPEGYVWYGFISPDVHDITKEMSNTKVAVEIKLIAGKEKGTYNLDYRLGACTNPDIIASDLIWGEFLEPIIIDVK